MTGQFFIALLNPAITFLLSAAFLVLWLHRRRPFILLAALAFFVCAISFWLRDIMPLSDVRMGRLVTNALFSAALLSICAAFIARYEARMPHRSWALILIAGAAGLAWYNYVDPRLDIRIHVMNATHAGLLVMTMVALRSALRLRSAVDYLLVALFVSALASLAIRSVMVVLDSSYYRSQEGLQYSTYWSGVQFTVAVASVAVALTLLVAVTLELMAELRAESRTDQLSGILNRRGFEEEAGRALAACVAAGRPSVMLMADLDHFKRINDAYGHAVGDGVIVSFARALRAAPYPGAVLGRVGGEEFAVFLPGGNQNAARTFAESVRSAFLVAPVDGVPRGARLTASFGVHSHVLGESLHDMMGGSDKALYAAKDDGRDRVNVASVQLRAINGLS